MSAKKAWRARKQAFEAEQRAIEDNWQALASDKARREELLEAAFETVDWPRETLISFELRGNAVPLDIDLPEEEDMPRQYWEISSSGAGIKRKDRSDAQVRMLYSRHVHAIALLAASLAFWALPEIETVQISGYTQRQNKTTGQIQDDYILSVIIPRYAWDKWTVEKLERMDPVLALEAFELRRDMTKTAIFKSIEPFA